ncbi:MAG: hypothetical protein LWW99_09965 [Deltaproteobacteria bacterium]|nr:hypothetical protein [Deltaproteobacteria bacterium]
MKKFMRWGLAALAAFALMLGVTGNVSAMDLGFYDEGVLVPRAIHNASNVDTVVGLTATAPGIVYWTYFSRNSDHLYDHYFPVTANDLYGFSLMGELGSNLIDQEGYLVFTLDVDCSTGLAGCEDAKINCAGDDETPFLAANSFLVDTTANDAIFVPVLPLDKDDYAVCTDLLAMDANSIEDAENGIPDDAQVDIRYWIDPVYCAATQMVVWTVGNGRGPDTVNVFDDAEHRTSLTMCWRYKELNLFDPTDTGVSANDNCVPGKYGTAAAFTAWPSTYIDGFMRTCMPADGIAYSYITSTYFGAAQTLLAAEGPPCDASPDGGGGPCCQ